jgi:hypothetical protein
LFNTLLKQSGLVRNLPYPISVRETRYEDGALGKARTRKHQREAEVHDYRLPIGPSTTFVQDLLASNTGKRRPLGGDDSPLACFEAAVQGGSFNEGLIRRTSNRVTRKR